LANITLGTPNTTELIDLINQLRQMSTQIPADQQANVAMNLEDLAAEAAKPEAQRSQPRLKRSLEFLATTGKSIEGLTKFANTAIDLAHKFGIHLPFNT
jgi:tRNA A37 N6-isopentenylltransferase MiaA